MRLPCLFITMIVGAAWSLPAFDDASAGEKDTAKEQPRFKLPKDAKTTVISLDFKGGFTPPRTGNEPTMSILADGTVVIPVNYAGQKAFRGKLDENELQDLLAFVIRENEFFQFDPKAVQDKLNKQPGPRLQVADAATTVIRVEIDGKTHEASHYALGIGPTVKELDQLRAIQRRLMQVRSIVELGGQEAVDKWLKLANQHLKQQHPDVKPLTREHLQSGTERVDGSVFVSFVRSIPGPDKKPAPATTTSVTINQRAGQEPLVNVVHRAP